MNWNRVKKDAAGVIYHYLREFSIETASEKFSMVDILHGRNRNYSINDERTRNGTGESGRCCRISK